MVSKTKPQSEAMSLGYNPFLSEGSEKVPIFLSSTYKFKSALAGEHAFALAYGLCEPEPGECTDLIYMRINHPNLQITEERLTRFEEGAEDCAIFSSGMAAITTVFSEFLKAGDMIICGGPLYGGTDHYLNKILPSLGVKVVFFDSSKTKEEIIDFVHATGESKKLAMIYVETPANPTNQLFDINELHDIAEYFSDSSKVYLAVDNTYMGPIFQSPLPLGADLVLYSLTKYVGGHSDLVAGAVLGSKELIYRMKVRRTFIGNMSDPMTCWLLSRSIETLALRMERESKSAEIVAQYLTKHSSVEKVYYIGNLTPEDGRQYRIKEKQCKSNGAMISFTVKGGKEIAYQLLDSLKLISLAVSLGGNESLAESPYFMTHADVDKKTKESLGISPGMIRLSIGIEDPEDLISDLEKAFGSIIY
ncbi:MAG TPA: aminotransferase class I/II-fold pyridoxal phosphate-dependent enzyme [Candidatus Paceibacterota bacterium]|nr:aminotransferase class I/II-fold pyridoxal phosphate-dependent enzyme [Candidatus Paceibacterota bacterium]